MAEETLPQEVQYDVTYTNAPHPYDRNDSIHMDADVGRYENKRVRTVRTPLEGVAEQRNTYRKGLYLAASEGEWLELQRANAQKEAEKTVANPRNAQKECSNCAHKTTKLVDGRCKLCADFLKKNKRERLVKLDSNTKFHIEDGKAVLDEVQDSAPLVVELEGNITVTDIVPNVATVDVLLTAPDVANDVATVDVATDATPTDVATVDETTPAAPALETVEATTPTNVPEVDAPVANKQDALQALLAMATEKTTMAVSSCSAKEQKAKEAAAKSKELAAQLKAAKEEARLAKAEAKAARLEESNHVELGVHVQSPVALEKMVLLRQALIGGGIPALAAFNSALDSGVLVVPGLTPVKRGRKATDTTLTAPEVDNKAPKAAKAPKAERTPSKSISDEEIKAIKAECDAVAVNGLVGKEDVQRLKDKYDRHPVVIRAIASGNMRAKS